MESTPAAYVGNVLKDRIDINGKEAEQLFRFPSVGKTEPQITPEAFVYFGSDIEEKNVVSLFTLGTAGQMLDDRDFATIDSDFGWWLFHFLGWDRYHDYVS